MKKLFLLVLIAITVFSCSKKSDEPQKDEPNGPYYLLSMKYKPAYTGATEYIYTFDYDANNRLSSFRIKDYRDSLYNKIVYNDKGQIAKMGTAKEANALVFEYNSAGLVTKFTENRAPWNGNAQNTVYNYEYDAQGSMTKYTSQATNNPQTLTYIFAYKDGNVEKLYQQGYTPDYTFGYGLNTNIFYGQASLNFLRCANISITLWGGAVLIFNSKNEITGKSHRQPGEDQASYKYEYDGQKRPIKITEYDENQKKDRAIWELTWK